MNETPPAPGHLLRNLRNVFESHLAAQTASDTKAAMRHVHGASPIYEPTRRTLAQLLVNYRLECRLLSLDYVGTDGQYAYVRVRHSTRGLEGPAFRDNVTDQLAVMRAENGTWKIWSQALLGIELTAAGKDTDGP